MFCTKCGFQIDDDRTVCPQCGCSVNEASQTVLAGGGAAAQSMPMKWFKFLIYFSLFANAVINVYNGFAYITGLIYAGTAKEVYEIFNGLQVVDVTVGVLYFAIAAFAIYTRFRLARFRKNGPMLLYSVYIANCLSAVLYTVGVAMVKPNYMSLTDLINVSKLAAAIISAGVMIAINCVYFNNRKHMFVN